MTTSKDYCLEYATCIAEIHFPDAVVRCKSCPLMETYSRPQCRLTGEYLAEGYLRGYRCPLTLVSESKIDPDTGEIKETEKNYG